jgi:2'-5' RNA ligase
MMDKRSRDLRLFVACELPQTARDALAQVQDDLKAKGAAPLRWVRPEGIHLTLKFLGGVPPSRLQPIEHALAAAIDAPFALRLRLGAVGSFGGRQRLRVVWVGLEGDVEELAQLADSVERALDPLGFPREKRPFSPHLTLARVPDHATADQRLRLASLVDSYRPPALPSIETTAVSLMQSFLEPTGARYQRLAEFPITRGAL